MVVLVISTTAVAQQEKVEEAIQWRESYFQDRQKEIGKILQAMELGEISPQLDSPVVYKEEPYPSRYFFRAKEDRDRAIQMFRDAVERGLAWVSAMPISHIMSTGKFGYLPNFDPTPNKEVAYAYEVHQIIDYNNMVVSVTSKNVRFDDTFGTPVLVWMVGRTSGVTYGKKVAFNEVFMVSGTRPYTTATGEVEEVHVLERVDVGPMIDRVLAKAREKSSPVEKAVSNVMRGRPWLLERHLEAVGREVEYLRGVENEKNYSTPPDDKLGPIREWRFMNTQTKMTGAFVALAWPTARVKTADGETITVVVSQLSRSDQAYIHHLAE
jgi:hypothetical protein